MNKNPARNSFGRLCGPLLIYWGIQIIAQIGVGFVLMITDAKGIADLVYTFNQSGARDFDELMVQMTVFFTELVIKYQVQIQAGIALCTIPVSFLLFKKDRKWEKEQNVPVNKKAPLGKYIWILLFGAAINVGMSGLMTMTQLALSDTAFRQSSQVFYSAAFPVQIICLGIIVPLAEELLFRGVMFKRYREFGSFMKAAVLTAIFFGFMHSNSVQLVYSILLGIFLAYMYEKYGSFKAPFILHVSANLTSIIGMEAGLFRWIYTSPERLGMSIVVCAFVGAVAFVQIQRIDEKPDQIENKPDQESITVDMFR